MKKRLLLIAGLLLTGCENIITSSSNSINSSSQDSSIGESNSSENSTSSENSSQNSSSNETSSSSQNSSNSSQNSSSSENSSNSSNSSSNSSTSSDSSSQGEPGENELYQATIENNCPDDYYESVRGLKGEELKDGLHEIIKGHKSYGYSSTTSFFKEIDRDPEDSSKMYFIYTGLTSTSTSYNKEHVWAKSHGDFGTSQPTGSDLHNLHPCNSNLNSTRSNYDFAEGGTLLSQYPGNNRINSGKSFEPSDFSKGDTARTIFYMAVRYDGEGSEPNLEVNSPSSNQYYDFSNGADGVHGNFDDLYKWATTASIDPVDNYEVSRNNIIYSDYQHNRNPFIDHPEFIQMIYDKNYNGPGALNDMNPGNPNLTPQEEVNRFIDLVDAIGIIDENSLSKINEAKEYYEKMSQEAQQLASDYYQNLLDKEQEYYEFIDTYLVEKLIELIDSIGEVTLDSKDVIEEAERLAKLLNEDQLSRVSNYQTLLDARTQYDILYEEYLNEQAKRSFEGYFKDAIGVNATYSSYDFKINDKDFSVSKAYMSGGEFRLGHNKAADIDEKFKNALPNFSDGSVLECKFDIVASQEVILKTNGMYGDVNQVYTLVSYDEGATYELLNTAELNFESAQTITVKLQEAKLARYAFVVNGSKPRLKLDYLKIW